MTTRWELIPDSSPGPGEHPPGVVHASSVPGWVASLLGHLLLIAVVAGHHPVWEPVSPVVIPVALIAATALSAAALPVEEPAPSSPPVSELPPSSSPVSELPLFSSAAPEPLPPVALAPPATIAPPLVVAAPVVDPIPPPMAAPRPRPRKSAPLVAVAGVSHASPPLPAPVAGSALVAAPAPTPAPVAGSGPVAAPAPVSGSGPVAITPAAAGDSPSRLETLALVRDHLFAALERRFSYPPLARRRNWEGEVVVRLTVATDGRLNDIALARTSGHELLDQAALATLEGIGRLELPEGALLVRELALELPIVYRLQ